MKVGDVVRSVNDKGTNIVGIIVSEDDVYVRVDWATSHYQKFSKALIHRGLEVLNEI